MIAKAIIALHAKAINDLAARDDADIYSAVDVILAGRGKVIVTGLGKSGLVAQRLAATFTATGTPSFFLHAGDAIHGDMGVIDKDDLIFAISNSGETHELVTMIKGRWNAVISITAPHSPLAEYSDVVIDGTVKDIGPAPMISSILHGVIGNCIAQLVLERRGYGDFYKNHPGGALGKSNDATRTERQNP